MSPQNTYLESASNVNLQVSSPTIMERSGTLSIVPVEKPFTCAVCLKRFKSKDHLKDHIIFKEHILHQLNDALPENLKIILPKHWKYGAYKLGANNSSFSFLIHNVHTKEDAVTWLKSYMEENKSKFVSVQGRSLKTGKQLRYLCEHRKNSNRDHKYKKIKGTGCKCAIFLNLSRAAAHVKISNLHHNHSLTSAAVISFHKPTENVKQIFLEMFNHGAGPSEALNRYKNYIRDQNFSDVEYLNFGADKSKMPSYDWVYYVYKTQFKKKHGSIKSHEFVETLNEYTERINSETSDPVC